MSEGSEIAAPEIQTRFPHVLARVIDTPLLIDKGKLDTILSVLGPRAGFDARETQMEVANRPPEAHRIEMASLRGERQREGHYLFGQTAVIPVVGTLIHRRDVWMEASGFTSYAKIEGMMDAALNDRLVESIIMEIDSPGGEVSGAFDLADFVYNARKTKSISAVVNEFAASAGYLIASAATDIAIGRTGRAGSIGVVSAHLDYSKALDKAGVAVTYIYAGEKKIDGNSTEPLSSRVKAEFQAEIETLYQLFIETVARNRAITTKQVRDTQAGMFTGRKAIEAGLATRLNTFNNELSNSYNRHSGSPRITVLTPEREMSKADPAKIETPAPVPEPAPSPAIVPAPQASAAALAAAPAPDVASVERARIQGILAHPEATDRRALAAHLAFATGMSAEDAGKLMAFAPKDAAPQAGSNALDRAMERIGSPKIAAGLNTDSAETLTVEPTTDLYARRAKAMTQ